MTKTVLIADDDGSIRSLIGRLMQPLDWMVLEAADGCAALERLNAQPVDLVLLDLKMPLLSGLEVLRIIRRSKEFGDVPVIMLSGVPTASTTAEIMTLGIQDYLVKPFRLEFLRDRLTKMDRQIRASLGGRRKGAAHDNGFLMVIDDDAEYRAFITTVLGTKHHVLEAPSGVAALRACGLTAPAIVLVGTNTGIMPADFLARKLREQKGLESARIVLIGNDTELDSTAFDATLLRTFVPDEFSEAFERLFGRSFDDPHDMLSQVRHTVESATEQAIGMMAAPHLTMRRGDQASLQAGQMEASVDVALETERVSFRLAVRTTLNDAVLIASHMLGLTPGEVAPEDALATLGELANVIAGRVKTSVTSKGDKASFTLPVTTAEPEAEPLQHADVVLQFSPGSDGFSLLVLLQMLPRRKKIAPGAESETAESAVLEPAVIEHAPDADDAAA